MAADARGADSHQIAFRCGAMTRALSGVPKPPSLGGSVAERKVTTVEYHFVRDCVENHWASSHARVLELLGAALRSGTISGFEKHERANALPQTDADNALLDQCREFAMRRHVRVRLGSNKSPYGWFPPQLLMVRAGSVTEAILPCEIEGQRLEPEQFLDAASADERSDIYSLGVILYELLTGKVPFTGSTPFAVMTKVLSDPVPPVRDMRPDLSPAIEAVVMKSLAKNPAARYQNVTDMASSLQAAVSAAFMPASALRISGDASNTDVTVAESHVRVPSAPGIAVHDGNTLDALPPTNPPIPASPFAPWQQQARPWQWPSQNQAQAQDNSYSSGSASGPAVRTYRQGRRLFYYAAALIALCFQFPVFVLLVAPANGGDSPASLGVLLGAGINLLILAALGFTVVTRSRDCRRFFYRCLAATLLAPLASGFFIDFGAGSRGLHLSALAYVALLLSNIYALRQLAKVDITADQVEVAPVFWRPAIVGALTGLLPLTIVLIFALAIPSSRPPDSPLLPSLLASLFIALIGAPTPGAMMAVWLSKKMSFAELSRSSAIAGMLMFFGAFLFIALWSLLPSNYSLFFYRFGQPWIVFLLTAALFGLVGLLRGMLDAWVYQQVIRRNKANP
jgi:hypothetical protein